MNFMPSNNVLMYIVVGIVMLIALVIVAKLQGPKNPYKFKARQFLTANEEDFFKHFVKIFPDKYIAPQVSMDAVIEPDVAYNVKNREGKSAYQSMRGTVKANKIDFLILNNKFKPEFIIELDDNSHNSKVAEDAQRDKNLMDANIPTIRIRRNKDGFPSRAFFDKQLNRS